MAASVRGAATLLPQSVPAPINTEMYLIHDTNYHVFKATEYYIYYIRDFYKLFTENVIYELYSYSLITIV